MVNFLPKSARQKIGSIQDPFKEATKPIYEKIYERQDFTQTMIDALGECRKWVGRRLYRSHYVVTIVALKLYEWQKGEKIDIDLSEKALHAVLDSTAVVVAVIDEILGERSSKPISSSSSSSSSSSTSSTSSSSSSSNSKSSTAPLERRFRDRVIDEKVRDMARSQIPMLLGKKSRSSKKATVKKKAPVKKKTKKKAPVKKKTNSGKRKTSSSSSSSTSSSSTSSSSTSSSSKKSKKAKSVKKKSPGTKIKTGGKRKRDNTQTSSSSSSPKKSKKATVQKKVEGEEEE